MPQAPKKDCELCNGTGIMNEKFMKLLRHPPDEPECLCTVTTDEILAALPDVIDTIIKNDC